MYLYRAYIGDRSYIGVTDDLDRRMYEHRIGKGNKHLANKDFEVEILCQGEDSYILETEKRAIKVYNTMYPNGFNLVGGGAGPKNSVKRLSDEELYTLRVLYSEGRKQTELAELFSLSAAKVSLLVRGLQGDPNIGPISNTKCTRVTEEEIAEMKALAEEGLTTRDIAKIVGRGKSTVSRYIR